jgi:hypothetical protein
VFTVLCGFKERKSEKKLQLKSLIFSKLKMRAGDFFFNWEANTVPDRVSTDLQHPMFQLVQN